MSIDGQKAGKAVRLAGYALDQELEKSGVRVVFGRNSDGSERWVHVFPINTARYESRLQARRKRVSQVMLRNNPEIDLGFQRETIAELIFTDHGGWFEEGDDAFVEVKPGVFELRDGVTVLPNDYDTRLAMLEDRNFFLDVTVCASSKETFQRQRHTEEAQGNSPRSSSGS